MQHQLPAQDLKQIDNHIRDIALKYMEKPAWGVIVFACLSIIVMILSTTAALLHWWPFWLSVIVNIITCYLLFTPVHEAIHHTINGRNQNLNWLNSFVGWGCGMFALIPYKGFRAMHLRHHQNTNDPQNDPDYWVHNKSFFVIAIKALAQIPAYFWYFFVKWRPTRPDLIIEIIIAISHYVVAFIIMGIAFYFGYGYEVLFLWIVPAIVGIALDAIFFDWLVHKPHINKQRFYNTSVILFPRGIHGILSWVMVQQNYHLVHHLYPGIPFYRYGKAFYEMQPYLEKAGSPILS